MVCHLNVRDFFAEQPAFQFDLWASDTLIDGYFIRVCLIAAKKEVSVHKKALIAGIGAIFCWSLMIGFLRLTTVNYGSELGIALIYTLGAAFLFLLDKPTPLKKIPRRYLLIGGVLFATYELFMAFAVGLAQDSFQAIEVSILNYLWPTLTVLFWAVACKSGRASALFRVIPGAVFATAGIVLAVGGSSLLAGAPFFTGSLWPYLLAISASIIWAVYSVATPRWACGSNSTAYFHTHRCRTLGLDCVNKTDRA